MRRPTVRLVGDGIGIFAAWQSFRNRSIKTVADGTRDKVLCRPALVLDEAAVCLVRDLFGPNVFKKAHQLRYRRVRWGPRESVIAQGALSMRSEVFLDAVRRATEFDCSTNNIDPASCAWTLHGLAEPSQTATAQTFGRRVALTCEVGIPSDLDPSVCMVETSEAGWVFLVPLDRHRASLQGILPTAPTSRTDEALIELASTCSTTFRQAADNIASAVTMIPSAPWIGNRLSGDAWLRVGSGAIMFDPLCGDGTAQSIRTGVLAAACTLLAINEQRSVDAFCHYDRRLRRTFGAHLRACSQFYGTCQFDHRWRTEVLAIRNSALSAESANPTEFALRYGVLTKANSLPAK